VPADAAQGTSSTARAKPVGWWRCARDAARIDPVRLAYIPGSEALSPAFWVSSLASQGERGVARGAVRFLRACAVALVRTGEPRPPLERGSVLAMAFTVNQRTSLAPACQAMRDRGLRVTEIHPDATERQGFQRAAFICAFPFLPFLIARLLRARGYARESFAWAFDSYWMSYGLYIVSRRWLAQNRPAMLIVANDHNLWPRVFAAAANASGIPTGYVQHASVAPGFPPLEFDFAFLDGEYALDVYQRAGETRATAYLVGIGKLDVADTSAARSGVVVCTNKVDPVPRVTELLEFLRRDRHLRVTLRPHPATDGATLAQLHNAAGAAGAAWSDARTEKIGAALHGAEHVIAGESAVLLEAAALGASPIMYDFSGESVDWYGFVRTGLAVRCNSIEELRTVLDRPPRSPEELLRVARLYCDTAGTSWAGRAGELIADVVAVRFAHAEPLATWQRISGTQIPAFRVAPVPAQEPPPASGPAVRERGG
jgi:hypothetical protein